MRPIPSFIEELLARNVELGISPHRIRGEQPRVTSHEKSSPVAIESSASVESSAPASVGSFVPSPINFTTEPSRVVL